MEQDGQEWILQSDSKKLVSAIGSEAWLSFPPFQQSEAGLTSFYCALIPIHDISAALARVSWELSVGDGLPGCTIYHKDGEEKIVYLRFGDDDGVEPLLISRKFNGMRPDYREVSEEFRLFHKLYFDQKNNKYIKIDDRGNEEDSVIYEGEVIKMRVKHIRQFLGIKEMALAVYFDIHRWATGTLAELNLSEIVDEVRQDEIVYDFAIRDMDGFSERSSVSRLLGKKLIFGYPKEKCAFWPYHEKNEKKYEQFIIGVNEDDDPLLHSCNPSMLSNYFGANPDAPHYLKPVFFKREVMGKYYANPQKYHVADNTLMCGSLWGMSIDNNHSKYIIAYLGDLGRDLSHDEQLYWKSFNVIPDGTISKVEFKRAFLAQAAEPEQADLRFKSAYKIFCDKWLKHQGWPLFKPLNEEDGHVLAALRVPLTNDFEEFDSQILKLAKLLVDSLNDAEIQNHITTEIGKGDKSIAKFELYLKDKKIMGFEPHIKFFRELYQLRSIGAGHRKGSDYIKKAAQAGIQLQDKDLSQIIAEFLDRATDMLSFLDKELLS